MHDPLTVAFDIKIPLPEQPNKHGHLLPRSIHLLTIWHKDPEKDGSDDSCGWSHPKVGDAVSERLIAQMVENEENTPFYFTRPAVVRDPKYPDLWEVGPGDAAALIYAAYRYIHWERLPKWRRRWRWSRECPMKLVREAMDLGSAEGDHLRTCFVPQMGSDKQSMERTFWILVRSYARVMRPWWRHPRWHFWHWRFQLHPYQQLKRRYWERCGRCRKRYKGGTVYGNWDSTQSWCEACNPSTQKPAPTPARKEG